MKQGFLDLETIGQEVLTLLQNEFGLRPNVLSVNMVLEASDFDAISDDHPDARTFYLLQKSSPPIPERGRQITVIIQKDITLEDIHPSLGEDISD